MYPYDNPTEMIRVFIHFPGRGRVYLGKMSRSEFETYKRDNYNASESIVDTMPENVNGIKKDFIAKIVKLAYKNPADYCDAIISNPSAKITAIKVCRDMTGMGLKEAKDYVEEVCECN
jgi:hypothetical protein